MAAQNQPSDLVTGGGVLAAQKEPSFAWWFGNHKGESASPWLLSTISELDEKTKEMLKLIEEDADSFAQRAEMYYKKRPELLRLIEHLYRSHRSLAEQYDQLRSEGKTMCRTTSLGSPFSFRSWSLKLRDTASTVSFESEESEVDDPDEEGAQVSSLGKKSDEEDGREFAAANDDEGRVDPRRKSHHTESIRRRRVERLKQEIERLLSGKYDKRDSLRGEPDEMMNESDLVIQHAEEVDRLKMEISRLKVELSGREAKASGESEHDEEEIQVPRIEVVGDEKEKTGDEKTHIDETKKLTEEVQMLAAKIAGFESELAQKDEEKREAIRQLCFSMDVLNKENQGLRRCIVGDLRKHGKRFDLKAVKNMIGKLFAGGNSQPRAP